MSGRSVTMYIDTVPNRSSPPAILLREGWREGGKVKKRTIANLSKMAPRQDRGPARRAQEPNPRRTRGRPSPSPAPAPTAMSAAVLASLRGLGLERLIAAKPSRRRALVVAMIVARILAPRSKLATARGLCDDTLSHSLAGELGLGAVDEDALYAAMDWLLERQGSIERRLARRHLADGALVLYDVSSTWMEGRCCPLARHGYARDGKRGKAQIVFGLLCNAEGCPVAVEVFAGDTARSGHPGRADRQVAHPLRAHPGGPGGRPRPAHQRAHPRGGGAGRARLDQRPARAGDPATGFGRDAATLAVRPARPGRDPSSRDFPGERLIACRNPLLAERRARKREALLRATERDLGTCACRNPAPDPASQGPGQDRPAHRQGHRQTQDGQAHRPRDRRRRLHLPPQPAAHRRRGRARRHLRHPHQPARDGPRRPRHSARLQEPEPGRARPSAASRTVDLKVRPRLSLPPRAVCAPTSSCACSPIMSSGTCAARSRPCCSTTRTRPVPRPRAPRSWPRPPLRPRPVARRPTKRTLQGAPVHSFQTLLDDLATIAKNRIQPKLTGAAPFEVITRPTALQRQALDLLGLRL